jgi:hypothetical protein
MHRTTLLIVTTFLEMGTGLVLLLVPAVPVALLLGVEQVAPEALLIARVAGAALLAIGIGCWLGRRDDLNPSQRGVLAGVLFYDVAAAGLLVYAGLFLNMAGLLLWPAVILHAALAVWCVFCFRHPLPEEARQ